MVNTLENLLTKIYADSDVSISEVNELRELTERTTIDLLNVVDDEDNTKALCESFEVTNQLLQPVLLKARKAKNKPDFRATLTKYLNAQLALLEANKALFE